MRFDSIDVIGATGAVGRELLSLLAERSIEPARVRALASERSEGVGLPYGTTEIACQALDLDAYAPAELVVLACDAELSKRVVKRAAGTAQLLIDNSSAFRADPAVPLVIPELLGTAELTDPKRARLVASPNCSAIQLALVIAPLRRAFGLESVHVATYQAVSGAGQAAQEELEDQHRQLARGEAPVPKVFPHPIADNVFPHESAVDPATGWSGEELKLLTETRRLLGAPDLKLMPSCTRVPVPRAHAQAVHVELGRAVPRAEVLEVLSQAAGLEAVATGPTPAQATGGDRVLVGRVRSVSGKPGLTSERFALWTACDQLRKGAALNVLQIAGL